MPRGWAIAQCQKYFGLDEDALAWVMGEDGLKRLFWLWQDDPATFYDDPRQILRQEWFHAAVAHGWYGAGGFFAALPAGAKLLDFGCGTAEVARLPWIARQEAIVLVDASDVVLDYLQVKYADYPRVRILPSGGADWRDAGPYDGLLCTDVLEHLPDPLTVQRAVWETLKPGGYALLKFSCNQPHPGHLPEAIAQLPAWWAWLRTAADTIEMETYAWVQKKPC